MIASRTPLTTNYCLQKNGEVVMHIKNKQVKKKK